jgi:hypothetical protein
MSAGERGARQVSTATICNRCGHAIVFGQYRTARALIVKRSCYCGDILGEPEPVTIEETLTRAKNSMVHYLDPDELERFATAEQSEKDAREEIAALCRQVLERKLTDWEEKDDDPEALEILAKLGPEIREAASLMYPNELETLSELHRQLGAAQQALANLMAIAGTRAEA